MKLIDDVVEGFQQQPERSAWGLRILGGLAITAGVVEYYVLGEQSTGEFLGDTMLISGGLSMITASHFLGRFSNQE